MLVCDPVGDLSLNRVPLEGIRTLAEAQVVATVIELLVDSILEVLNAPRLFLAIVKSEPFLLTGL